MDMLQQLPPTFQTTSPFPTYDVQSHSSHNYMHPHTLSPQPLATQPPMATPAAPLSPHMTQEFKRMTEEMNKMFKNMQTLQPVGNVDDWRLSENFRIDNPVIQDRSGQRKFHLEFDVRQFKPEEIEVKTFGDQLTVHAKHEDKEQGKSAYREYQRQFTLPKEVNPEVLSSKLSTEGVLLIEAPLPALEGPRDKMIPIQHRKI